MNKEGFTELNISGKRCFIRKNGENGQCPVIYWATYLHQENELEDFWQALMESLPEKSFLLLAFLANDWNRDFSPWPADPVFGKESFAGCGKEMQEWLIKVCLPEIENRYSVKIEKRYLIGYSLAGLFALWTAYETSSFQGIASCSGSLWYPGWDDYVANHILKSRCDVYLSLGGKEEKTKNKVMATVGDRTRQQEKILRKDARAERVTLEWNSGGHFADSAKRLAKGVKFLLADNS